MAAREQEQGRRCGGLAEKERREDEYGGRGQQEVHQAVPQEGSCLEPDFAADHAARLKRKVAENMRERQGEENLGDGWHRLVQYREIAHAAPSRADTTAAVSRICQ